MENFRRAIIVIDFLYTQHTYYTFKGKMFKVKQRKHLEPIQRYEVYNNI